VNSATCSHKPLKTSKEDPLREDTDSCFKRIPIPKLCKKRKINKRETQINLETVRPEVTINQITVEKKELITRTNLKISILMRSQRISKVKRKT